MRTVTIEETEDALASVAAQLEIGMALNPNSPCEIFAALLEMHGLWRGKPFQVSGEKKMRGLPR